MRSVPASDLPALLLRAVMLASQVRALDSAIHALALLTMVAPSSWVAVKSNCT